MWAPLLALLSLSGLGLSEINECLLSPYSTTDAHFILLSDTEADCNGDHDSEMVNVTRQTLNAINANSSIQFGVQVIATCSDIPKARLTVAAEIYKQLMPGPCSTLIGIIDTGNSGLEDIVSGTHVSLITTGEVHAPAEEPRNVYRVNTDLETRAKVIARLAVKLNWDYVTVLNGSGRFSQNLEPLLNAHLQQNHLCVGSHVPLSKVTSSDLDMQNRKSRGVILIGIPDARIVNLIHHPDGRDLTWIVSHKSSTIDSLVCQADHPNNNVYCVDRYQITSKQVPNLDQLMAAIYAQTAATQSVVQEKCPNNFSSCSELEMLGYYINERMPHVEVSYDDLKTRNALPPFYLQNNGSFKFSEGFFNNSSEQDLFKLSINQKEKGVYKGNDKWELDKDVMMNRSSWCSNVECSANCLKEIKPNNYIFVPGDFVLIVTTPVHDNPAKNSDAYTCGIFNTETSLRAEAALYARDRLNSTLNISIGLLVFDTCFNTALAQRLLGDALYGTTKYCYNNQCLNRSKIVGVISDYTSDITIALQQMIIPTNLIQVSFGSATSKLDDKETYSHFLRTQLSQSRITTDIVQLLKTLSDSGKAAINSVVVINTDSEYGSSAAKELKQKLNESDYCVLDNFELNESGVDRQYRDIWTILKSTYDLQSLVIVYVGGEEKVLRGFLDVLNSDLDMKSWWKKSGSIFVFPAIIQQREIFLDDYGDILKGAFSFELNTEFKADGFCEHLKELRPSTSERNPWFQEMYQKVRHCKERGSFINHYPALCTDQSYSNKDIRVEIYAIYVIKTMYAFMYGFKDYMISVCDKEKNFSQCEKLYKRTYASAMELKEKVGKVLIPASDTETKPSLKAFDPELNGNGGYVVSSIQCNKQNGNHIFVNVFKFRRPEIGDTSDVIESIGMNRSKFYQTADGEEERTVEKFDALDCVRCSRHCPADTPSTFYYLAITFGVVIALLLIVFPLIHFRRKLASCKSVLTALRIRKAPQTVGDEHNSTDRGDESTKNTQTDPQNLSIPARRSVFLNGAAISIDETDDDGAVRNQWKEPCGKIENNNQSPFSNSPACSVFKKLKGPNTMLKETDTKV